MQQPTHQQPVYQFHIIRCGTIIPCAHQRVNRQSPNIAHVITSTISPHTHATFGQDRPRGYFPPYSRSYHSVFYFFARKIFLSTQSIGRWTDFNKRCTDRRVFTQGSDFSGLEHSIFTPSPPKPPNNHFWVHIMVSLRHIHIRITAWCIEIRCWNLARCLT